MCPDTSSMIGVVLYEDDVSLNVRAIATSLRKHILRMNGLANLVWLAQRCAYMHTQHCNIVLRCCLFASCTLLSLPAGSNGPCMQLPVPHRGLCPQQPCQAHLSDWIRLDHSHHVSSSHDSTSPDLPNSSRSLHVLKAYPVSLLAVTVTSALKALSAEEVVLRAVPSLSL